MCPRTFFWMSMPSVRIWYLQNNLEFMNIMDVPSFRHHTHRIQPSYTDNWLWRQWSWHIWPWEDWMCSKLEWNDHSFQWRPVEIMQYLGYFNDRLMTETYIVLTIENWGSLMLRLTSKFLNIDILKHIVNANYRREEHILVGSVAT